MHDNYQYIRTCRVQQAACQVCSFGIFADGTDDVVPVVLQEAEINVQSNADCADLMPTPENPRINDGHVCVYDERPVSPEEKRNVCSVSAVCAV